MATSSLDVITNRCYQSVRNGFREQKREVNGSRNGDLFEKNKLYVAGKLTLHLLLANERICLYLNKLEICEEH